MAIAVTGDEEWRAFSRAVAEPWCGDERFSTLEGRKRCEEELDSLTASWTGRREAEEVMGLLQGEGVAAGIVQTAADLYRDPQLACRGALRLLEHEELGQHVVFGQGFTLSATPQPPPSPAPRLGEHTLYLCREVLGMEEEGIASLIGEGILQV